MGGAARAREGVVGWCPDRGVARDTVGWCAAEGRGTGGAVGWPAAGGGGPWRCCCAWP